jgi:tetratricopeptide (TPR) repeat protein
MDITNGVKRTVLPFFCVLLTFSLFFIISLFYYAGSDAHAAAGSAYSDDSLEARIIAEDLAKQKKVERKSLITELFGQAKAEYDSKNYDIAQQMFEGMVQIDPKNKLANHYIELCKDAKIKDVPGTVTGSMIKRGKANYANKQYAAAIADFETALASNPDDTEARAWLAKARRAEDLYAREKSTIAERRDIVKDRAVLKEEKDTSEQGALRDVDRSWLPPAPPAKEELQVEEVISESERAEQEAKKVLVEKMRSVMVPAISVTDADIQDLIRQLMEMTGVTIVVDERELASLTKDSPIKISLSTATPMPLLDVLEIAFKTTQLSYKVEPNYVYVSSKRIIGIEDLVTRTYKLKYPERKTREVKLKEFEAKGAE